MMRTKIVLMYHDVFMDNPNESGFQYGYQYKLQVDRFEKHISKIKEYCTNHPDVEVELTFDDGGVSFFLHIAPILEKYNFKGLFFISTDYLNTATFLTLEQVRELYLRGHRIASHSHTHAVLTTLNEDEILKEWETSLSILKPYLGAIVEASIPGGHSNKQVIRAAHKSGVEILYTSEPTLRLKKIKNMQIIGRYAIYHDMTESDVVAILSSSFVRAKMHIRMETLKYIRFILGPLYLKLKLLIYNNKFN